MSFPALAWATASKVRRAADKLVLLGLADRHNTEYDVAYPSLAWLCEFSSLDRKTVVTALDRLERDGFINDSGKRVGKTKQVKAYRLNLNSAENGSVKTEPFVLKDTAFPLEQSQKRDTDTVKEPVSGKAKAFPQRARDLSEWVPLPLGWSPTRHLSVSNQCKVAQWPPGAFDDELESFRAWAANAAPVVGKGLKKDWDDAFGNWIRAQHDRITRQQHRPNYGKNPTAIALSLLNT